MDQQKNTSDNQDKNPNRKKKRNRKKNHYRQPGSKENGNTEINKAQGVSADKITAESESLGEKLDINTAEALEKDIEGTLFDAKGRDAEVTVAIEDEKDVSYVHVAGIRFKSNGKIYFFDKGDTALKTGEFAIVDTARGLEFGEVAFSDKKVKESSLVLPLRPVVRAATNSDIEHNRENKEKESEAFKICKSKIDEHKLEMKLIDAQYSFDNSKLLFYFTSATRVDFRELVKDLASIFKTRIELRQIGIRDETKLLGGLGVCGRSLCCSSFLSDFTQVSIKMAKEQNLSLNSGKISGACGRLMCCLQYEYSTYVEEGKLTPPVGSTVKTRDGVGTVTEANVLAGTVKVRLSDKSDMAPVLFSRNDVTLISKPSKKDID